MRVDIGDTMLLGAPLFSGAGLDKSWSAGCDDPETAVDRLRLIGAQDTLILLRSSFSAHEVLHLLGCSPSVSHPLLQSFHGQLKVAIESITSRSRPCLPCTDREHGR